ncbi:MAG: polysaccharide biosynthesis/export family protein [Terracidiphilus sp.]
MQRFVAILAGALLAAGVARGDEQLRQRPVYTLHTGDEIALNYRYTPEFNQTATVQPDGSVNLNIVGDVQVEGMSVDQARKRIVGLASSRLNHPELTITLVHFQTPYVVVAGEVDRPGKYDLNESMTALQAVLLAGGFKDSARDTKVFLFRRINADDAEVRQLDLHNIKNQADLERDAELEPGDMLLVTRNRMEHFSRFMKASNLGVFLNPYTAPVP